MPFTPTFKSQFKLGAHTFRPKSDEQRNLEITRRRLEEDEYLKQKDIQQKMETLAEIRKMEDRSRDIAEAAAATEVLERRASLSARERDRALARQRELERMNDLGRAERLERERRASEFMKLENLKREEDRRRAMIEAEKRIRILIDIQRQRALNEAESRDLRMYRERLRQIEALSLAQANVPTLGLPPTRTRTNSIGHIGLSPRGPPPLGIGPPRPISPGFERVTTTVTSVGAPVPLVGGGLAAPVGRPRAKSFGAGGLRRTPSMGMVRPVSPGLGATPLTARSRSPSLVGRSRPGSPRLREAALLESQKIVAELESARKAALLAAEKLKHERMHNAALNAAQKEMLLNKERKLREQERELERKREIELERKERELDRRTEALEERERKRSFHAASSVGFTPGPGHLRTPSGGVGSIDQYRDPVYALGGLGERGSTTGRSASGLSPGLRAMGLREGLSPLMDRGARSVGGSPNTRAYNDVDAFNDHSPPFGSRPLFDRSRKNSMGAPFGGSLSRKSSYGAGLGAGGSLSRKSSLGGGLNRRPSVGGLRASPLEPGMHAFPSTEGYGAEAEGEFYLYEAERPDDGRHLIQRLGRLQGRSGTGVEEYFDGDPLTSQALSDLMIQAREHGANAITNLAVDEDGLGGMVAVGQAVIVE